ncbi:hypothetical protein AB0I72_19445 [Nocardiopsis sp. NPDC049922]|uniref:hypothetical protein n=1 Tax=Nocardiopsis sp. NPDC049922 TaxID=3155157 RepID=UPI0034086974
MIKRLTLNVDHVGRGKVELDGDDISNVVRAVTVAAEVGQLTEVTLGLKLRESAVVDTDAVITVPDETRDALIHLGWMPPDVAHDQLVQLGWTPPAENGSVS